MNILQIEEIMTTLSKERPVFHSEADFQHAFAWIMHSKYPQLKIRLEYPMNFENKRMHIDILAHDNDAVIAIELKYKTRGIKLKFEREDYILQNQAAQDLGRYDFIKDISRLETITSTNMNSEGFAIFLTNDRAYWKVPNDSVTIDHDFRINEGALISGLCDWDYKASKGTKKSRENSIKIKNKYLCTWFHFSDIKVKNCNEFKYLIVSI